jgi:hypothetical protein
MDLDPLKAGGVGLMTEPAKLRAVERAAALDMFGCLRVVRFGKPTTEDQLALSNACFERLRKLKAEDPTGFTAASKALGWG